MNISLCRCNSDHERLDKNITVLKTAMATIKEETSVVDPTFIIQYDSAVGVNFNYVTCSAWGRNYYVRDITALPGSRLAVTCHCDVLSSFANGIRAASAVIDKQETEEIANKYIDDGDYVMECKNVVQVYQFGAGFANHANILITAGG